MVTQMNELQHLPKEMLQEMLSAGLQARATINALGKGGLNIVGECLKGQGDFYELSHYPKDDVYDADSKSQYYFHTHRGVNGEYGHFHTFLRAPGMPATAKPIEYTGDEEWPSGDDALSHLICISMNQDGIPMGLFTTNRWVTAETWYSAEDVISMLDLFQVDHASPNLAVNLWITSMFRLFKVEIAELLVKRDQAIRDWQESHPDGDVFEDRELEVTSAQMIDVDTKIAEIQTALGV